MAKAAEEIQAMRTYPSIDRPKVSNYLDGDWYLDLRSDVCCSGTYEEDLLDVAVWLPRLDQILGMLAHPSDFHFVKGADFHELAIKWVMREKYGKVWRDGAWLQA